MAGSRSVSKKISAEEVENHILAHPRVENCAYVAMPDRVPGEKGCAFATHHFF